VKKRGRPRKTKPSRAIQSDSDDSPAPAKKKPPPAKKKPAPVNPAALGGTGNDSDDSTASGDRKPAAIPGKRGGRGGRGRGRPPLCSRGRGSAAILRSNNGTPVARARLPGGRTPRSVKAQGGRQGARTPGSASSQGRGRGGRVQITPIRNPDAPSLEEASPASLESIENDAGEEEGSQSGGPGVRSQAKTPTHVFVRDMVRRTGTYFVKNMANNGNTW